MTLLLALPSRQGHLKVEAFYRSRPVFRVSPAATHEKQEKRVFAGSDTLSPGQRSSRSGKGPAAPCNPAFATFKSPCRLDEVHHVLRVGDHGHVVRRDFDGGGTHAPGGQQEWTAQARST